MLPHDEAGQGPAIVLLHAGIADRSMWSEHLQPLAEAGYRVVAPDLPGFGEAAATAGEQAPWNDVVALLDELGIDRAAVVGNSYGGAVALRVAVVAPDKVTALALISAPAPGLEPSAQLEAAWEAEEAALEREDFEAATQAVLDTWTLPDAPPQLRDRVAAMQRRAFELQSAPHEVSEGPDPVDDDPAILSRIDVPALVAAGERDMADFQQAAGALADALPRARLEVIPGAGHLAPLEVPDAFRALLLDFLPD